MSGGYDKTNENNPNWKGGITKFRSADELLSMPQEVRNTVLDRLYDNIVEEWGGCWIWTGPVFKSNGRAKLILGTNFLASRLMFVLMKGPTNGLCVLHTCDDVICVNPDHLFLGTNADNAEDMVKKNRQARGERNGGAILTEEQVREIKKELNGRRTIYGLRGKLANKYNVHPETISRIFAGKSWRTQ